MGVLMTRRVGRVTLSTAKGNAQGFQVKLDSVGVGKVQSLNVDAVVMPQAMPFMLRVNDQLTLTKKDTELLG